MALFLLADENVPGAAISLLRDQGHDISWVLEDAPSASDRDILARAQVEQRILITFDKDFGEFAFGQGLPATSGVILLRLRVESPLEVANLIAESACGTFELAEPLFRD